MGSGSGLYDQYVRLERELSRVCAERDYWKKRWDCAQEELNEEATRRVQTWDFQW